MGLFNIPALLFTKKSSGQCFAGEGSHWDIYSGAAINHRGQWPWKEWEDLKFLTNYFNSMHAEENCAIAIAQTNCHSISFFPCVRKHRMWHHYTQSLQYPGYQHNLYFFLCNMIDYSYIESMSTLYNRRKDQIYLSNARNEYKKETSSCSFPSTFYRCSTRIHPSIESAPKTIEVEKEEKNTPAPELERNNPENPW